MRNLADAISSEVLESDMRDLGIAAKKLANHAYTLQGIGLGFATTFLKSFASFAAIYLLILDRTNWKSNILTSLLFPYIFLSLPSTLFFILRGEVSRYITLTMTLLQMFFPKHFPDWLALPGIVILLIVIAPELIANTVRDGLIGIFICLVIGCYLLQEHIRASGGFRNAFTKSNGISNTLGIVLLFVYPVWGLVLYFL